MSSRRTGPDAATVKLVRDRDEWACTRCGVIGGVTGLEPLSTQHRQARGMGGTRRPVNVPSNLLTLCGTGTTGCHGWVEHHPTDARAHGWAVASWDDPTVVPVWSWRGWIRLDNAGDITALPDHQPELVCDCGCGMGQAS